MKSADPDGHRQSPRDQPHELIRLVTRLLVAQAVAAAAVGLPFSRRHLPSILITLALTAGLALLAVAVRRGGHAAWLVAISAESAFVVFGVSRFLTARYVGGTLLGLIVLGTLLQPSVGRAFAVRGQAGLAADGPGGVREAPARAAGAAAQSGFGAGQSGFGPGQDGLEDAADGPLGHGAAG